MKYFNWKSSCGLSLLLALAGCGGGSPSGSEANKDRFASLLTQAEVRPTSSASADSSGTAAGANGKVAGKLSQGGNTAAAATMTAAAAAQFLAQATFGPNAAGISNLMWSTKVDWLNAEFQKPQVLHRAYTQKIAATLALGSILPQHQFFESFWTQAVSGDDQLRQRVVFALSQIFVVSMVDSNLSGRVVGVSSYYDTLGQYAFGNFRDLLQAVALHPMMGLYLTHLRNQKEGSNRLPDENFAREVMQLMTIGLYQLNPDGTQKMQNGKPIETYTHDDVAGLAKVFTGWSWAGPDQSQARFYGSVADPAREWTPMQNYPAYHSTSSKSFLGTTIGGGTTAQADLKIALDTLFKHPNVGPFISRQLIQRLVSSNPSPAYVGRVAAAFANNGSGVRGDMRAVIRAILLDREAVDISNAKKLREPILRLANWMRAFNAKSASGRFLLGSMEDPLTGLGQSPMRSPSVFNFYRPTYSPAHSNLSAQGMYSPEMQIVGEPSVTGYLNLMQSVIPNGVGTNQDIQPDYTAEVALAAQPVELVDRVNLLLHSGMMPAKLRSQIATALNSIVIPAANGSNGSQIQTAKKNRVCLAIYLAMASPEYLAQR